MPNQDDAFENVQVAFRKGDPRPLATWILNHDNLTSEQRQFVAQALCGNIEKIDGRKVKPTTDLLLKDYATLLWANRWVSCFGLEGAGAELLNESEIARKLANKYGYQDPDSVRRLLAWRGKGLKKLLKNELTRGEKSGHEKK